MRKIDILDNAPAERFDRLTRLAKRCFRVPIARVRLVERLQSMLDRRNIEAARGYDIRFSVGRVGYGPSHHATVAALRAESDTAMYAHTHRRRTG